MFLSNFVMNLFIVFILISSAVGQNQSNGNFSFDAPLIGEQNLPLVATLDFSKIDTELKSYISNTVYRVIGEKVNIDTQQEIDKRIKEALPQITDAVTENIRSGKFNLFQSDKNRHCNALWNHSYSWDYNFHGFSGKQRI